MTRWRDSLAYWADKRLFLCSFPVIFTFLLIWGEKLQPPNGNLLKDSLAALQEHRIKLSPLHTVLQSLAKENQCTVYLIDQNSKMIDSSSGARHRFANPETSPFLIDSPPHFLANTLISHLNHALLACTRTTGSSPNKQS